MVRERLISALKSSRPKFVISGEILCVIAERDCATSSDFSRNTNPERANSPSNVNVEL
jgi:hypothetical protein